MTTRTSLIVAALASLSVLAGDPASAHEYWLSPSTYWPKVGESVSIGALSGEGFAGERKPYSVDRAARLVARAGRELDLGAVARGGDSLWAHFAPVDRGGALLAYESNFASITIDAATFERYLAEDGLDAALAARRKGGESGPGRERYRRCAKAWLAGTDVGRATRPLGLPLEIVPLTAPGADSLLAVRVLWRGMPLPHVLLHAWHQPFGGDGSLLDPARRIAVEVAWSGRTDRRGEARVPVAEAGEWLLGAVHMTPSRERAVADWESTWASLTFGRAAVRP
jgi:hypothetical protein